MPLADNSCLIAVFPHQLWEGLLGPVEVGVPVPSNAVSMPVFTRKNRRAARSAESIGHIALFKKHPFARQLIDMRGVRHVFEQATIRPDRLIRVIITEDEKDVRGTSHSIYWRRGHGNDSG